MRQGSNNRRSRGRNSGRRNGLPNKNQTFESSGPESHIRIRGNATQVQEKYMSLARDALNSGDRILAENFFQHAEHYYRVMGTLNEAHAQASAEQQNAGQQRSGDGQDGNWSNGHMRNGRGRPNGEQQADGDGAQPSDGSSPFASDPRESAAEQSPDANVNGADAKVAEAPVADANGGAKPSEGAAESGEAAAPVERQVRTRRRTTRSRRSSAVQKEEPAPATETE